MNRQLMTIGGYTLDLGGQVTNPFGKPIGHIEDLDEGAEDIHLLAMVWAWYVSTWNHVLDSSPPRWMHSDGTVIRYDPASASFVRFVRFISDATGKSFMAVAEDPKGERAIPAS